MKRSCIWLPEEMLKDLKARAILESSRSGIKICMADVIRYACSKLLKDKK